MSAVTAFMMALAPTHITGPGTVKSGDRERMLNPLDTAQMLGRAAMGLMDPFSH